MKKFKNYLADVLLRSSLLISDEELNSEELSEETLDILEEKLYEKLRSGEWREDIRIKRDFNTFKDYSGGYSSVKDFIKTHGLKNVAEGVFGEKWELEDDNNLISDLMTSLGVNNEYIISVIEDEDIEKDIIVTSVKHLAIYKNTYKTFEVYYPEGGVIGRIENIENINEENFRTQLLQMGSDVELYVDDTPESSIVLLDEKDDNDLFTIRLDTAIESKIYVLREIK